MVGKACTKRLQIEYRNIQKEPPPFIDAHPSPNNILEWHYALKGPPESPYEGGTYHGKVIFPSEYPFRAPSIMMCTPSGRFAPNTRICMSMTDFHPEKWQACWSVATILTGLDSTEANFDVLSFMLEDEPTTGAVKSTEAEKQQCAKHSLEFNCKNLQFRRMFPGLVEEFEQKKDQASQPHRRRQRPSSTKAGVNTASATASATEGAASRPQARKGAALPPGMEVMLPVAILLFAAGAVLLYVTCDTKAIKIGW